MMESFIFWGPLAFMKQLIFPAFWGIKKVFNIKIKARLNEKTNKKEGRRKVKIFD